MNADVAKDEMGKSRGFGLVTFETVEDCKAAIEKFEEPGEIPMALSSDVHLA